MAKRSDPFAVKLDDEDKIALTRRLVEAVRIGMQARTDVMADGGLTDFAYALYEQQPQNRSGADLSSPIATQMVDTLTAIACKTIFVEPIWIAEGLGKDAAKAPAVEEYLQWRAEEMRAQATLGQGVQASLIEKGSIIEVCEDAQDVKHVEVIKAKIAKAGDGSTILDEKAKPMPMRDDKGDPVPADDTEEFVEVRRERTDVLRRGASLRRHSQKDFLFLPGHARDMRDVWGMAVRFWMPLYEVREWEQKGHFDKDAVEKLGTAPERLQREEHNRQGISVDVDPAADTVEKEFWRVQFFANLDGESLCFYVATISVEHEAILRLQHDWIGRFRFAYLNPFPNPNSMYGHSLVLDKLLTTIEGHTAWRNMNADRGMLKANAPMKRLHGALWDPNLVAWRPGVTIDVADMNEVQPFEFDDVSQYAFQREREFYEEAARIAGISDILASVNPKVSRTLGENEMVTEQSFTRAESPIRNIQEAFEDIAELIHAIEVKTLEESDDGLPAPASVAQNVQLRMPNSQMPGDDAAFAFTAEMIKGRFRFKPRGSVETADPNRRLNNFANMLKLMGMLAKMNPALAQRYMSPQVADAINQQFVDFAKIRDKQAFLAPLPAPPMMPGAPGAMPPGAPPGAPMMGAGGPGAMPGPPAFGDALIQEMLANLPEGGAVQ